MSVCVQYLSDLHVDLLTEQPTIPTIGDVLVLSGGIGNPYKEAYSSFLRDVSKQFEAIFLIAGTHEFYSGKVEDVLLQIHKVIEPYTNIHFLNDSYFDWKGIRFYGMTLWSDITQINCEFTNNNYISKKQYTDMHKQCIQSFEETLSSEQLTLVVLSHHLPSYQLIHIKNEGSPVLPFIVSNCEQLIRSPVGLWIYGQYQENRKIEVNGIPIVSNAIGYPGENIRPQYDLTIQVQPVLARLKNLRISIPEDNPSDFE